MRNHDDFQFCLICGCTEFDPCETDTGPCGWYDANLCTACADEPLRLVFALCDLSEWVDRELSHAGTWLGLAAAAAGLKPAEIIAELRGLGIGLPALTKLLERGGTTSPRRLRMIARAIEELSPVQEEPQP